MTIAEWCVLVAVLIYLLTIAPFKAAGGREFDNQNPRDTKFYQPALRSRALGAHINGIETFPFFAFAVLLAEFRHAPQSTLDHLALIFIATVFAFVAVYLAGWGWDANRHLERRLSGKSRYFLAAYLALMPHPTSIGDGKAALATRSGTFWQSPSPCPPWRTKCAEIIKG